MNEHAITGTIVTTSALFAALCLAWWLALEPPMALSLRLPEPGEAGSDEARGRGRAAQADNIEGVFARFDGTPSRESGQWPRFRGADFSNIARSPVPLRQSWPPGGPPVLWSILLGEGHSGPVVVDGRVYVLDYDEEGERDALRCFSLADGREIWRRSYQVRIKRNHGMSRTVPAVADGFVVTVGPKCHVLCVDAETGAFRWGLDMVYEYGTQVPLWYTGQCPLIDDGVAVLAPGGRALMIGVDCASGEILWETPNPDGWQMSHSSIIPMSFGGRDMYVYCALGGIVGVAADGPDRGEVLWKTREWDHKVLAPSPVPLGDGRIFLTAGYGGGSMMLELAESEGQFSATSLYSLPRTVFATEQQTPVWYEGHLYAVLPNDAGADRRQFACLRPDGERLWTSGRTHRFGLGPFLVIDDKVLILNDDGVLTMIRATSRGYEQLAQAQVLHGRDAWAPMAFVNGKLLLRDWKEMICLDLRRE